MCISHNTEQEIWLELVTFWQDLRLDLDSSKTWSSHLRLKETSAESGGAKVETARYPPTPQPPIFPNTPALLNHLRKKQPLRVCIHRVSTDTHNMPWDRGIRLMKRFSLVSGCLLSSELSAAATQPCSALNPWSPQLVVPVSKATTSDLTGSECNPRANSHNHPVWDHR